MKEALKLAVEALKLGDTVFYPQTSIAIAAIEAALAQQEPWCMKMNGCKTKCEDCPDEPDRVAEPAPSQEPVSLADEVIGCFEAAEIEGLAAALENTIDYHLKDLIDRRLMYALYAARESKEKSV